MTISTTQQIGAPEPTTGMRRFFSPKNLRRYRRLANGGIGQEEQRQLLKNLAEEMDAFRHEAYGTAVEPPPLQKDNTSQAGGQT